MPREMTSDADVCCQWLRHVWTVYGLCQMLQVIDTAYGITGAICGLMGTLGYLMYGNGVKDVVTFNLPPVSPWPCNGAGVSALLQAVCHLSTCSV